MWGLLLQPSPCRNGSDEDGRVEEGTEAGPGFQTWAGLCWARAVTHRWHPGVRPALGTAGCSHPRVKCFPSPGCVRVRFVAVWEQLYSPLLRLNLLWTVAGKDEERILEKKPPRLNWVTLPWRIWDCPAWLFARKITSLVKNSKKVNAVPSVLQGYVLKSVNLNL